MGESILERNEESQASKMFKRKDLTQCNMLSKSQLKRKTIFHTRKNNDYQAKFVKCGLRKSPKLLICFDRDNVTKITWRGMSARRNTLNMVPN